MKNKLKKQKRRVFASIAAGLFALSLLMFAVISYQIYDSDLTFYQVYALNNSNFEQQTIANYRGRIDGMRFFVNNAYETNVDMKYYDKDGDIVVEKENALAIMLNSVEVEERPILGCIKYDDFKKSMTEEQIATITEYLNASTEGSGYHYDLLCTEFYSHNGYTIPKILQICKKDDTMSGVPNEYLDTFELNITVPAGAELYHSDLEYLNEIDKDFFLNGYNDDSLIEKMQNEYADEDGYVDIFPIPVEPFTYVMYFESPDLANGEFLGTFVYAERINILDSCLSSILMMGGYILVLFAVVGVIIGAIIWKTLKKQIEQENRLRTVTNAMAHELKTPLFVIGGFAENLTENINTEKREHYSALITEQTAEMNKLVSKMLEYSKLDSANFTLKKEKFALNEIVKQAAEKYDFSEIELDCDEEVFVNADKALIKTAVENLLENAVKYSDGSGKINVTCKNGKLTVSNPYKEVSAEEIKNMWEPYHRNADENDKEGHGIGLAMVKSIMNLHTAKCRAEYSNNRIAFILSF